MILMTARTTNFEKLHFIIEKIKYKIMTKITWKKITIKNNGQKKIPKIKIKIY
jgi:hypothetical protein